MKSIATFMLATCIFGNHVMAAAEECFEVTVISPHRNQHTYTIKNEDTVATLKAKVCNEWFRGTRENNVPLTPEELNFYVVTSIGIIIHNTPLKDTKRVSSVLKQAEHTLKWLCKGDTEIFYRSLEVQEIIGKAPPVGEGS